jgi:hypothetical protein
MSQLTAWQSFYVIIGSAAGALIGLQFVVMALIANLHKRATTGTISAFGTPTVFHFGGALLLAAIMSAPWPSLSSTANAVLVYGLAGFVYGMIVVFRARRQTEYKTVWADWLWHAILPCKAYAALALSALFVRTYTRPAMFVIGGAALGLLFIGIHNAWDTVTYLITSESENHK